MIELLFALLLVFVGLGAVGFGLWWFLSMPTEAVRSGEMSDYDWVLYYNKKHKEAVT